jgi:hypothetical protein
MTSPTSKKWIMMGRSEVISTVVVERYYYYLLIYECGNNTS